MSEEQGDGPPDGEQEDGPPGEERGDGPARGERGDGPARGERGDGPARGERGDGPTIGRFGLPVPTPSTNPETERFWAATATGRLLLGHCEVCGNTFYYPRARCPDCLAEASLVEASGEGTVYSYSVVRQAQGEYADAVPYVVASVELAEGPHLLTNVVGCAVDEVRVDQPVELVFDDTGDGPALPRFTPTA